MLIQNLHRQPIRYIAENQEIRPCRVEIIFFDKSEDILSTNPHEASKGEHAYSSLMDRLFLPDIKDFHSPEKFYHTYFHELSHWTGDNAMFSRVRLNSSPVST